MLKTQKVVKENAQSPMRLKARNSFSSIYPTHRLEKSSYSAIVVGTASKIVIDGRVGREIHF